MTAYYERYERVKGMASFLSDDCAVGSEDAAAAVEAQLAGDADYRAQFVRRIDHAQREDIAQQRLKFIERFR